MAFINLLQWFFSWLVTFLVILNLVLFVSNVGLRIWRKLKKDQKESVSNKPSTKVLHDSIEHPNDPTKILRDSKKVSDKISHNPASLNHGNYKMMAVIGSGGHTMEMINLLNSLKSDSLFTDYVYVIGHSDQLSRQKVNDFEKGQNKNKFSVKIVPRAREVGQSYISSIWTTLVAAWHSLLLVWNERPHVVLSNGPAIGFLICFFARILELFHIHQCRIVFVESICRVKTLSLTGNLLYHLRIPHVFLVQWHPLQQKYPRSEFIGRLV